MLSKRHAGEKAVDFVKEGMVVGLGTGSTVYYTIQKLGELVSQGLQIAGVSTSMETTRLAQSLHIPLVPIEEIRQIDVTIDGADEVDLNFNGIKGGGGALLYEKIVAHASKKVIWVVDESKMVERLGVFPLPIEIIPFGYKQVIHRLAQKRYKPVLRLKEGEPFRSDGGHYIVDLHMGEMDDPHKLNSELKGMIGVVETGLFHQYPDYVIIGSERAVRTEMNEGKEE